MFQKFTRLAAVMLICMPIGGGTKLALGRCLGRVSLPALSARSWLGLYELAIVCGCLAVLGLTSRLRRG